MREDPEAKLAEMLAQWASFMKWHPNYEKWLVGRIHQEDYQQARINNLLDVIGDLSRKRILDLGCGMGGLSVALRREGFDVIPLDFNIDYCRITKLRGQRYVLDINPINAMGESLPLKSELFDAITLFDVLEHVQRPAYVLRELYRVLKPGGSVFATVINRYAFRDPHYHLRLINWVPKKVAEWYIKQRKRGKSFVPCEDRQKLSEMNYFGFSEFKGLAKSAGFDIKDVACLQISQPSLIRNGRLRKCAQILKSVRLSGLAYLCFRSLSRIYVSSFEFVLYKPGEENH